jgi:hypothetical protein
MNKLAQFQAIADAQTLIAQARCRAAGGSNEVWQKLKRVGLYLSGIADVVAADLMRDDGAGAIPDDDCGRTAAGNVYSTDGN